MTEHQPHERNPERDYEPIRGGDGEHQAGDADTNVVDLPIDIKGISKHERIVKYLRFPDDRFAIVGYVDEKTGKYTHYRMVLVREKEGGGQTAQPVIDGLVSCVERGIAVQLDPRTREIGSEVQDHHYRLRFRDNRGSRPHESVVKDTELLANRRDHSWLSRLGMSELLGARKYTTAHDLVRAVVYDQRNADNMNVDIVDRSGIVRIGGKLFYATPSGYIDPASGKLVHGEGVLIGAGEGAYRNARCRLSTKLTRQYNQIRYPATYPEQAERFTNHELREIQTFDDAIEAANRKHGGVSTFGERAGDTSSPRLAALDALAELLDGYDDRGVTGVLVGQLIGSPLAGLQLRDNLEIASVSNVIGPTQSGKTAYAMLVFATQTRTVYGETEPEFSARVAPPGGSGGQTSAGIMQNLRPHNGILALLDDVMKEGWSEKHLLDAQNKIYERVLSNVVGGGVHHAQGNAGKIEAADSKRLYLSVVFTAERVGMVTNLAEDSVYNRMANVWWDAEHRCDAETFDRLKSREHTLERNNGMRVVLDTLLANPDVLVDGYERALKLLDQAGTGAPPRVLKTYARALAGLHALDVAFDQAGRPGTAYLDESIEGAVGQIERMMMYGTRGGDQRARFDVVEASRELCRLLLTSGNAYVAAPGDPADDEPTLPEVPGSYPDGMDHTHCGFVPINGEWQPRPNAVRMGELIEAQAGTRGRPHSSGFAWRVQMSAPQWHALNDRLHLEAGKRGYRDCTREDRADALINAGVLHRGLNRKGRVTYSLDFEWLWDETETDESEADNGETT